MRGQRSQIRLATEEDIDQVRLNDLGIDPGVIKTKIEWGEILVCDDGGQITGILRFQWFWDHLPFINHIWVEEGFREEHRATRMIRKLEELTAGKNYGRIMTSTQSNETGQNFFRKVGFEDAGGFTMRDQSFELIMIKYIEPDKLR
ncbi:MAG: GNAT family N-acetyltransferase [Verrucomicrobiae bacterium]|nr:GNAT family N-acetyltransferase [Verrucomicrobiae bacterium]